MRQFTHHDQYHTPPREHYQNWRIYVLTGLSVLSLLLSIIAVTVQADEPDTTTEQVAGQQVTATEMPVAMLRHLDPTIEARKAATHASIGSAAEQVAVILVSTPTPTTSLASISMRETEEPTTPTSVPTVSRKPDPFFDPQRLSYAPDFYQPEIQAFLDAQPGTLKDVSFQIGNRSHTMAEVLVSQSNLYSFNPKILLTLLEQQSQLVSDPQPSPDQLAWAMGFRADGDAKRGLYRQLNWAVIAVRHALRDYAIGAATSTLPDLVFADDTEQAVAPDISLPAYVLSRVLARTTTPDLLQSKLDTFLATHTQLFGDPRQPLTRLPPPAAPFLYRPMEQHFRVTSFFDHDTPFLHQNGSLTSYWGTTEAALSYDGHTGWDYAMWHVDPVLAAADGTVVFAGNSDDGCISPAQAVIIDHDNGYRTLYWHLSAIDVTTGQFVEQGTRLGMAGDSGCAIGPHLHFQVQYLGRDVDPYGWCGDVPDPWARNPAGQVSVWLWEDMFNPCAAPPPGTIVVDDTSPGFTKSGEWEHSVLGYGGGAFYSNTRLSRRNWQQWQIYPFIDTPAVAAWQPELPATGQYRVLAYIPYVLNGMDDSQTLRYRVQHSGGETHVTIDAESTANAWADLGTYSFNPAGAPRVLVSGLTDDWGRGFWADAIAWVPVE